MITGNLGLIAPAELIASTIAGAGYVRTGIEAVKVGAVAFLLPLLIIWAPILTLNSQEPISAIISIISCVGLVLSLQIALVGYYITNISTGGRAVVGLSAGLLFAYIATQSYLLSLAGFVVLFLLTFRQWRINISSKAAFISSQATQPS